MSLPAEITGTLVPGKRKLPVPKFAPGNTVRAAQLVPFDSARSWNRLSKRSLSYNLDSNAFAVAISLCLYGQGEKFDSIPGGSTRQKGAFIEEDQVSDISSKIRRQDITPKTTFITPLVVVARRANQRIVKSQSGVT
jgi:hypothetical protein